MSFLQYKKHIEEGDTVIIYLNVSNLYAIVVVKDEVFQTRFGALRHNDLIGKQYGTAVSSSKGWVYVLFPTPELWTVTLPHRTQILYSTDISMIILQLDLNPGKIVCESGTGSGSLSHALIRAIAPNGHLYTFDFHEARSQAANDDFKAHGLSHHVTVEHRDVSSSGFGDCKADAVFLDLPHPWLVVPFTRDILKNKGRFASFSPCVEQVQKTNKALNENGFSDITTMECVLRSYEVKHVFIPEVKLTEMTVPGASDSTVNLKRNSRELNNDSPFIGFPSIEAQGHTGFLTFATKFFEKLVKTNTQNYAE